MAAGFTLGFAALSREQLLEKRMSWRVAELGCFESEVVESEETELQRGAIEESVAANHLEH